MRPRLAVAVLLAAVAAFSGCRGRALPPVILISVDTLRADHVPAYGYRGVETPNLDALARDSVVFTTAYSQVPLTLPSHTVMLTGQPPYENGVRDNIGFHLAPSVPTLTGYLKAAGYATGAAVSTLALAADRGLDRDFDFYDDRFDASSPDERPGPATVAVLEKWSDSAGTAPRFLFLHLYEPHAPYAPPEPFRTRYASHLYDGEIAAADAAIGTFLADLKKRGSYDPALIVFLSDHGEGLGDHGEGGHGVFLYREAVHVPLFVKLPGGRRRGERVDRPVGLVDLFPTVARFIGRPLPPGLAGLDLLGSGGKEPSSRRIYSESLYPRLALGWSELYALSDTRYQYIEAPRPELYDLAADPGEKHNLAPGLPPPFRAMRAALEKIPRVDASPQPATPEELEKLGSLGYISVKRGEAGKALPDPKDRTDSLRKYKQLFELFYAKEDAGVVALAGEILKEEESMSSVWRLRAMSRQRMGDFAGAARDLELGLSKCPDAVPEQRSEMIENLASALSQAGDREKAERVLRAALAGPFGTNGMRVVLARLLSETGRAQEAAQVLPPPSATEDAATADARGVAAAESGRYEEARRSFEAALARDPENQAVLLHLGMLSLREKDAPAAQKWFTRALARNPDAPGTLAAMGLAQVALNDPAGAYESWSKAVRLDPSQYDALFNLAMLSGRLGKAEDARRSLERFVATAPPDRYAGQIAQARKILKSLPPTKG